MRHLFFLFSLILMIPVKVFSLTISCEITLDKERYFFLNLSLPQEDYKSDDVSFIKNSTCPQDINEKVFLLISQNIEDKTKVEEKLKSLKDTYSITLHHLDEVKIESLQQLVTKKLKDKTPYLFQELTNNQSNKFIYLFDPKDIEINCSNCQSLGLQSITFTSLTDKDFYLQFMSKALMEIQAFRVEKMISPQQTFHFNSDVTPTPLFTDRPDDYFTESKNIQYYRPSRTLNTDSFLKKNDLVPITLVEQNRAVRIRYNSGNISISTQGISRENGRYGDYIQVNKKPENKLMQAQVVGPNIVEIHL